MYSFVDGLQGNVFVNVGMAAYQVRSEVPLPFGAVIATVDGTKIRFLIGMRGHVILAFASRLENPRAKRTRLLRIANAAVVAKMEAHHPDSLQRNKNMTKMNM